MHHHLHHLHFAQWVTAFVALAITSPSTAAAGTETPALRISAPNEPMNEPIGAHQRALKKHEGESIAPRRLPKQQPLTPPQAMAGTLERVVYGYYPFWINDLSTIRWEALSHLAWFAINLKASGEVEALHGWPDKDVLNVAHAAGVRVDLTFTLFSAADIATLCASPARRKTAVDNIVSLMESGNADGISIDFEFVNGATRANFVLFIKELRAELNARLHMQAQISIAGPAVDWAKGMDVAQLLLYADWYFVMGYGYFWSGSSRAGPTGMLRVSRDWAAYQDRSMVRSIAAYSRDLPAKKRRQIIWGVPYYGRHWTTSTADFGATTIESQGSVTYAQAKKELETASVELLWHEGVANPWYRWQQSGIWNQVYFDDARSLAFKYALAIDQDLGGIGIWALGYDKANVELWDLLQASFGKQSPEPEGHRHAPIPIAAFPFHDQRDTHEGASHYFNYYSCDENVPEFGREWVYQIDLCQKGRLSAHVPEYSDRDPDLYLLSAPDQDACLARAHTDLEAELDPGRYFLVVDSFVDMPVALEGVYDLDVAFVPESSSAGCQGELLCNAGRCECPVVGQIDCDQQCVDPKIDPLHCGGCAKSCAAGASCLIGQCVPDDDVPTGAVIPVVEPPLQDDGGAESACSCSMTPTKFSPYALLSAVALWLLFLLRKPWHGSRNAKSASNGLA